MRRSINLLTVMAVTAATIVGFTGNSATGDHRLEWTGTWATALTTASPANVGGSLNGFNDQSIRMIVRTSVGGDKVRIRLSNAFGAQAIQIGHATVALPAAPATPDLVPESVRELKFGGSESVTIYKGADALSDPINWRLAPLTELVVTLYLPTATGQATWHWTGRSRTYIYAGDQAENASGAGATATFTSFYFLAGIDVASKHNDGSVVVLGNSISDGFNTTLNANNRWPDQLAERISGDHRHHGDVGVLNESLAGNEVTHDGTDIAFPPAGLSALARLDTDVFGQTGVQSVIIELGVNDIHFLNDPADRIIGGLKQLVSQLEQRGMRVLVCTVGPFEGYTTWTPGKEDTRLAVNAFIRDYFDHVVDMDEVLRDPAAPSKMRVELDSGDHIHPNDAGATAIAAAVPLWLL